MAILDAKQKKEYLPFKTVLMGTRKPALPDADSVSDPCKPAKVEYIKNPDGHYIFANNPEMLTDEDINICNLRTENMSGRYVFTFEHSNGQCTCATYTGYRLVNNGKTDLTVTVRNIGYQYEGEWLGARSWSDFYNLKFERPADYVDENGQENWYYVGQDFLDYTPRIWETETYSVPPGKYLWIFGGTTADNYKNINAGGTADILVPPGRCMNGTILFEITQGEHITGSFYFYTDVSLLDESKPEQGYITERNGGDYSKQYKGIDTAFGLIEASFEWTVSDRTPSGRLPVIYKNQYDESVAQIKSPEHRRKPYEMYNNKEYIIEGDSWQTSLNPQNHRSAIGTDMTAFHCVDSSGKPVIIDCLRADGGGFPGNFGNWMISYQDNFTFYNTGDTARTFKIYKKGAVSGALIAVVRDRDGNVLSGGLKCHPIIAGERNADYPESNYIKRGGLYWPVVEGKPYYEIVDSRALTACVVVQARSVEQVTVEYVILGNSNGGIEHWVELA